MFISDPWRQDAHRARTRFQFCDGGLSERRARAKLIAGRPAGRLNWSRMVAEISRASPDRAGPPTNSNSISASE